MQDLIVRAAKLGGVYLLGAGAGWAAKWIGLPLPYMIGPILVTAALYVTGTATIVIPVAMRPFGQAVVAAQVGLYFSPGALALLFSSTPLLVGMAAMSAVSSLIAAFILARWSGSSLSWGLVSSIPVGPVEAAFIAESCGMPRANVVLVQTLRLAAVVVLIPMIVYLIDGWPDRSAPPLSPGGSSPWGMLLLAGAIVVGALAFRSARLANPFFLGPLAATAGLTAAGVELTAFPAPVLALAQIVLGCWLGSSFRRDVIEAAGKIVGGALASTLLLILLNSAGALAIAFALGGDWENYLLGASPGGVTEMALTAQYLDLDVPLVTAFHLTRIFLIVPNVAWVIRAIHRYEGRSKSTR